MQLCERNDRWRLADHFLGPPEVTVLKNHRQALIHPRWSASGRKVPDESVGELVREYLFELWQIIQRLAHRDPNGSVVHAAGPTRTARDVPKLFVGIKDDRDDVRRIREKCGPYPPVGGFQDV